MADTEGPFPADHAGPVREMANETGEMDHEASLRANLEWTGSHTSLFPKGRDVLSAVRRKCVDCCCGDIGEIEGCEIVNCALWPFRMRKNPFRAPPSEETRERARKAAAELNKQRAAQ